MSKKQERWSWSSGERPYTVTVEERTPGGIIYGRVWNPRKKNWVRRSLKHRDRKRAKAWALDQAAKLARGDEAIRAGKVTLGDVLASYAKYRSPRKSSGSQKSDERKMKMWARVLGATIDPHGISLGQWERFIELRSSGQIDARGKQVEAEKLRPVRKRAVEADCKWLNWVFNWASKWRMQSGHYLMRENPIRGFEIPTEKNPLRPVATQDRFEAVRAVADQVMMETRWGKRETARSHLSELLDIVNGTGRRISAICQLTYEDVMLDEGGPYGSIRWPARTDKTGRETVVPVSPAVRSAIDRVQNERPGIGPAPLFPSPEDPQKPMTRHLADKWLRKGEKLAELPSQKGTLWHGYRRKWATERKNLSDVDVAAAGGWKTVDTLKTAYQQEDAETMLLVVMGGGELREAQ